MWRRSRETLSSGNFRGPHFPIGALTRSVLGAVVGGMVVLYAALATIG